MTAVTKEEICLGLSVRLDTGLLRKLGGCLTNASEGPPDRAVQGPHQFLILQIEEALNVCLAVPLFSKPATGNVALHPAWKSGTLPAWIKTTSFFSTFQHWWIPLSSIPLTSDSELTLANKRSYFAKDDANILGGIGATIQMNKYEFRAA